MTLLESIAHMEGFYELGSRSRRNLNPGDLSFGPEAQAFGALRGDPRFAVFPDATTGWIALKRWLSVPAKFDASGELVGGYMGASLSQVINRFAPPVENQTETYISTVCQNTGLTPSSIVTSFLLETPEAA